MSLPEKIRTCPRSAADVGEKAHLAAADEHQPGDAFIALDEKDRPFLQRDDEIFGRDLEIPGRQGTGRVDAKLVETFDRRQSFGADESPRVDVAAGRTPNIHARGQDARLAGGLDEELDDQAVAVAGRRALEWCAVPLANRRCGPLR